MTELKEQNQNFQACFEAGQSAVSLREDVGSLPFHVKEHQQTIQSMNSEIRSEFVNIEALLSTKQKKE